MNTMRVLTKLICLFAIMPVIAHAQPLLEVLPAQGNVFMIAGPGGNSAVQIGHEAVIVVDTQTAAASAELLERIEELSPQPIRHIINTSASVEHTGGNEVLSNAGTYVRLIDTFDPRGLDDNAAIMAHVNALAAMSAPVGEQAARPEGAWPTDTYFTDEWAVYVNNEAIQMLHVPAANTDADTIVFFRRSDVISTGDIFNTDRYPYFDAAQGGSIKGVLEGLSVILDLAIAGENQHGGTVIIPGHGRLGDETDVVNYRDMATIIYERIVALVDEGKTLQEILAAGPTRDYDGLYDDARGGWTGDMLVAAIYQELTGREQ
jgi:glyoxylase-like metal-dependent hydrolase (beta-lactamase superfamily II)